MADALDLLHNGVNEANAVWVGVTQEDDIEDMFQNIPTLTAGLNATEGWAFCHEPDVKWPALNKKADETHFKPKLVKYYKPLRWEFYKRMKKFGITAWGVRTVGKRAGARGAGGKGKAGTKGSNVGEERVPYVPPVGTGRIRQHWDKEQSTMVYRWFWTHSIDGKPDLDMRFIVWNPPDIYGNYTSPAAAALSTWKMNKISTLSASRAAYHGSHLPTFLVHNPPRFRAGEDQINLEFGDAEELGMQREAWARSGQRQRMSIADARQAVSDSRAINEGQSALGAPCVNPVLNSETIREREAREGNGLLERLVYLDDYRQPVAAATPAILVDPIEYDKRTDQICAMICDFPLSMVIEQHAQHAGNLDAQIIFARDRMKSVIIKMNEAMVDVLLDVEGDLLRLEYMALAHSAMREKNRPLSEAEYLMIYRAVHDLVVETPCTPLVTVEQFVQLWEFGLIDQETLAKHAAHQTGLAEDDMHVTPLKRQRELEMEQATLAKKQATDSKELEQEKIDVSKQATQDKREIEDGKLKLAATKPAAGGAKKKAK
jgi:hypothetical protein